MAISSDGVMIRTHADSVNLVGRNSLGVRLMKVSASDFVVSVAVVDRDEDEEVATETSENPQVDNSENIESNENSNEIKNEENE